MCVPYRVEGVGVTAFVNAHLGWFNREKAFGFVPCMNKH